jgi:hypothetical protein
MQYQFLVKHGKIVDGAGAPAYEKLCDVPDGEGGRTYRYSRAPAPMPLTLCDEVATFDNGAVTGRFPGEIVGPEMQAAYARAAE